MKAFKRVIMAVSLTAMSLTAFASEINIGGVTWDPDYVKAGLPPATDAKMKYSFDQWFVDAANAGTYDASNAKSIFQVGAGDELQGSGRVTEFNGLLDPELNGVGLCVGCELTFEFGGLIADNAGGFLPGGFFNFYVETGADVDGVYTEGAAAQTWLELAVDEVTFSSNGIGGFDYLSGHIDVLFSAVGGLAEGNFDTDTIVGLLGLSDVFYAADAIFSDNYDSDWNFVNSPLQNPQLVAHSFASGTGDARGDTIPEPTTIAIFGLALMGLAAGRYRKNV